jgi:hypothetical protein
MSVHVFVSNPEQSLTEIVRLCRNYIGREPVMDDDGATLTLTFAPDLSPEEETRLGRIVRLAGLMRVTPSEWAAIEPDIDGLRTYHDLASPTNAQSVAAIKAIIRVLRAILRDT